METVRVYEQQRTADEEEEKEKSSSPCESSELA